MKIDLDMVDITFSATNPLKPHEAIDCLLKYDIKVDLVEDDENDGINRTIIAQARVVLLDKLLCEPGKSLLEACNEYSMDVFDLYEILYDDDGELYIEPFSELMNGSVWYLEYLYVHPKCRNQGLGESIIDWIERYICKDSGAIVLLPSAIKNVDENGSAEFYKKSSPKLSEKLHRFYLKSGFFQVQGTEYLCRIAERNKGPSIPLLKLTRIK